MSVTTSPEAVQSASAPARRGPVRPIGARRKAIAPVLPPADVPPASISARVDVVAKSRMLADARAIKDAAVELLAMLEAFAEEHTANSIVAEARAAGVEINQTHYRNFAANLLHDVNGAVYNLEAFLELFGSVEAGVIHSALRACGVEDSPRKSR